MTLSNKEEKERFYNDAYFEPLAERYLKRDRWERNRIKNVLELAKPIAGEVVLDVGCAIGTFTIESAKRGAYAIGIDYAQNAIQFARRFFNEQKPGKGAFIVGDAKELPIRDNSLDLVICADITEHLSEEAFRGMLKECHRVLKSGGRLAIYTPSPTHIFEIMMRYNFILRRDETHIGLRKMGVIKNALASTGFKITRSYYRPTHLPVLNLLERVLIPIPFVGGLTRRRICILATKK